VVVIKKHQTGGGAVDLLAVVLVVGWIWQRWWVALEVVVVATVL
jgi:hypothetical protein